MRIWWREAAILAFSFALAGSAADHLGLHYERAMRRGVQTNATVQFVQGPASTLTLRHGYRPRDYRATLIYQRAPNDAPYVDVPVSAEFYRRYDGRLDATVSIHFLPGSILRPIIDEDGPPVRPWLWPAAIAFFGLAAAGLTRLLRAAAPAA